MSQAEKSFTCNECGTTGSLHWMGRHPCDEITDVRGFGGRCEDYPCCGHQPGECMPDERFTKDYWMSRYDSLDPDSRFEVDAYGWPDEEAM